MKIISDENIPLKVVVKLREHGHDVISISENFKGISDLEILKIAEKEHAYILTFDKDFGELIFRLKFS